MPIGDLLLSEAQMRRIEQFISLSRGRARVDDRRVLSDVVYIIRMGRCGEMRCLAPARTGRSQPLRPLKPGRRVQSHLCRGGGGGSPDQLMVDATHFEANRTAASLRKKGAAPRRIGQRKAGLNRKFHAFCDEHGRPPRVMLFSAGLMSDYKGAALMRDAMPAARVLSADGAYDADGPAKRCATAAPARCLVPASGGSD